MSASQDVHGQEPDTVDAQFDPTPDGRTRWALTIRDRILVAGTMLILLVVTLPRLPEGICFGDSGGLQLASATLGITHPPGYGVYATLGYLLTRVPGVDPAYLVTLACLASGLGTILLCVLVQARLGVPAFVACAIGLGLSAQPRVWSGLLAPEVYAPSLLLLAGASYALFLFEGSGKRRDLVIGALCLGLALANRPPVCFSVPFLLMALVVALRRLSKCRREAAKLSFLAFGVAMAPVAYGFCYLWLRDDPNTAFNYLEQYNAEARVLPDANIGAGAKLERVLWIASGQQFRWSMGNSWRGIRQKLTRWLPNELASNRIADLIFSRFPIWGSTWMGVISCVVTISGVGLIFRRSGAAGWALAGIALGSVVFVSMYRVYGDAANTLPLLFTMAVALGVVLSEAVLRRDGRTRTWVGGILFAIVSVYTLADAPHRGNSGKAVDANTFLQELDMASLPADTIVCSTWSTSPPLWYAQFVQTGRHDLTIINAAPNAWPRLVLHELGGGSAPNSDDSLSSNPTMAEALRLGVGSDKERLVLTTIHEGNWEGVDVSPYRNVWRISLRTSAD